MLTRPRIQLSALSKLALSTGASEPLRMYFMVSVLPSSTTSGAAPCSSALSSLATFWVHSW